MENGLVNGVHMNGLVDGMSTLVEMPQAVMGVLPGNMVNTMPASKKDIKNC